jgi:[ribosomal protein S5]-alanine N-acetyltransferase
VVTRVPDATPWLTASGARVHVRPVSTDDVAPYRLAYEASSQRVGRWNPVDPGRLEADLTEQSPSRRTFVVLANDPDGGHGLVGRVNVSNIVRGTFQSASLGYDAYDPYAGRGLFREGLGLVVGVCLRPEHEGGLGLHRVEANVQPGNVRSAMVLRSLGFRHEGETPRMLRLQGPGGLAWRDHERYAVTAQEWPAEPFAPHERARRVVVVHGAPGGGADLGQALAAELVLPLLDADRLGEQLRAVLESSPAGAVVVSAGRRVDVCGLPGPVVEVDGSTPVTPRAVARLALEVRAAARALP